MKISIFNANSDLGVHIKGTSLGPNEITKNLDLKDINITNIDGIKLDEKFIKNKININSINSFDEKLYNEIIKDDNFSLTIGGDHSITIASALASIKKHDSLGVIWIDAHSDYNSFETTETGNIHGLPLATICDSNGYELTKFHNGNFFKKENTVIFGVRDIDKLELLKLKEDDIKLIYYDDIKKYGIKKMLDEAFKTALKGTNGIHISYDLDSIDPLVAPGVSIPVKSGFNKNEVNEISDYLKSNIEKIKSMDLVEYNPTLDKNKVTLSIATDIINKIIK